MLEMTENDIFVHWKTAKSRKYEIDVLAQLNGTTPAKIREILLKVGKQTGEDVSEIEDVVTKGELEKQKKRDYQREYERKKRARKKAEKAEKAEEAPAPLEVVDPDELPEETEPDTGEDDDNGENDELIKKAVQYFSEDLAEAIYEQRLKVEEEKSKLRKMEYDLERCKRILGFGKEAEND